MKGGEKENVPINSERRYTHYFKKGRGICAKELRRSFKENWTSAPMDNNGAVSESYARTEFERFNQDEKCVHVFRLDESSLVVYPTVDNPTGDPSKAFSSGHKYECSRYNKPGDFHCPHHSLTYEQWCAGCKLYDKDFPETYGYYKKNPAAIPQSTSTPKPPSQAESETVLPMKMTVNVKDLIGKIKANLDKVQGAHDTATTEFNAAQKVVTDFVAANAAGVAKRYGVKEASDAQLKETVNSVSGYFNISTLAPAVPGSITAMQKQIQTLSLITTPDIEIEDNSPYLQYLG